MIRFESIGLFYTRTCPMACRHCITESSPLAKGKMDFERAMGYLGIIAGYTSSVCFTGGEPLLFFNEIVDLTRHARSVGLNVTVITGAGWANQEAAVRKKVKALAEAGLNRMTISWDVYHEEFSPRRQAIDLARIATEEGLRVSIRIDAPANIDPGHYKADFSNLPVKLNTSQIVRLGRASTLPIEHFQHEPALPKGACSNVLLSVIDHSGKVYACCGPAYFSSPHSPLILGDSCREPLEAILDRAIDDPVLEVISTLGPYGLYVLLQQTELKGLYHPRDTYTSICDLCLDLTNSPDIVSAIRKKLTDAESQILLSAARMWREKRLQPGGIQP